MKSTAGIAVAGTALAAAALVAFGAAPAGATTPAATSGASSAGAAPSAAAAACDKTAWQSKVQGRPAHLAGGSRGGDYLWHDSAGFHLRVTHKGDGRAVYTGTITASAAMRLEPVKLEGKDRVALSADKKTLSFSFADYGHIDGVNFHTDCASTVTVSHLKVGGHSLPAGRVYLGVTRAHPAAIPFTLHRVHKA